MEDFNEDAESFDYSDEDYSEEESIFQEETVKHDYMNRTVYHYTSSKIRTKIAEELAVKYGSKNGGIVEKHIYNATIGICRTKDIPLKTTDSRFQLTYASLAYDTLSSNEDIKQIVSNLKSYNVEWKYPKYKDLIEARLTEEADHSQDVVEGIHECSLCKKAGRIFNKTRNTQIQTRGGDEGMTVFVTCVICRTMWKQYN